MEQKKNTPEEIKLPPEIIKYEAILAKDPKSVVFAPLADAYRKAGMLDDAIRVCTEGLKYHPDHTGGRVVLGRVYFEKGLFDEAQRELERAVKISPENIVARKLLGEIYFIQGDQKRALEEFDRVLFLNPLDRDVKEKVRMLKELMETEKEQIETSGVDDERIKEAEHVSEPYGELGQETEELGETEELVVDKEEDLSLQIPDTGGEDEQPEDYVVKPVDKVFEEKEEDDICTLTLAEIYRTQKLYDKAIEVYEKLLKKEPNNPEIKERYESLIKELKGESEEKESMDIRILEEWLDKVRRIYRDRI